MIQAKYFFPLVLIGVSILWFSFDRTWKFLKMYIEPIWHLSIHSQGRIYHPVDQYQKTYEECSQFEYEKSSTINVSTSWLEDINNAKGKIASWITQEQEIVLKRIWVSAEFYNENVISTISKIQSEIDKEKHRIGNFCNTFSVEWLRRQGIVWYISISIIWIIWILLLLLKGFFWTKKP